MELSSTQLIDLVEDQTLTLVTRLINSSKHLRNESRRSKGLSMMCLAASVGIERSINRVGTLETAVFNNIHNTPHQNIRSLEARLTLLEQESARARAAEGDDVAFQRSLWDYN